MTLERLQMAVWLQHGFGNRGFKVHYLDGCQIGLASGD